MEIVAGLSLNNLKPRVWDPGSPYYLPELQAVMVSYADFFRMPSRRRKAMEQGLRDYLGVPQGTAIYLDNGAFYFLSRDLERPPIEEYEAFIEATQPDWYPVPYDYIPTPKMDDAEQHKCREQTMVINCTYGNGGYVPVLHVSRCLQAYVEHFLAEPELQDKAHIALGGIVPNLLRASRAMPYAQILAGIRLVRTAFRNSQLHVFGIGGTATLHLAGLFEIDSVDSSGWRNRAARGIVQLPGRGDRVVAQLGKWRGRRPSPEEWELLETCQCPACQQFGLAGLQADRLPGFCCRATHNLWVLLEEAKAISQHLNAKTYADWYQNHLDNTVYLPLITEVLDRIGQVQ